MLTIYEAIDGGTDGLDARGIGLFADRGDAVAAAKGRGTMGCGDGDVRELKVYAKGEYKTPQQREALRREGLAKARVALTPAELDALGLAPEGR
jgi:hypothetical protein